MRFTSKNKSRERTPPGVGAKPCACAGSASPYPDKGSASPVKLSCPAGKKKMGSMDR